RPRVLVFPGRTIPSGEPDLRTGARNGLFRGRRLDSLGGPSRELELDLALAIQDETRAKRFAGFGTEAGQNLTRPSLLEQLPRDLGRDRPAGDPLPDHEAAARLLTALPARAPEGAGVLADRLAAAGARPELDPLRPELLLVERGDLLHRRAREALDLLHKGVAVAGAVLDVAEPLLPVARQLGRGERVRLDHRHDLEALRRRLQVPAGALDVLSPDQRLDRLRPRRGGPETALLHRLAKLLVLDELAGGLHRREERRLRVARRRLRLLRLARGRHAADALALAELRQLDALALAFFLLRLPLLVGDEA